MNPLGPEDLTGPPPDGPFDPWTASWAEAAKRERWWRGDGPSPLRQWRAARYIEDYQKHAVESGNRAWILLTIRTCAEEGLVIPRWLAEPFVGVVEQVANLQIRDWNEAFGSVLEPGQQFEAARRRRRASEQLGEALLSVLKESAADVPIDRELWERVGARINISGGLAEKLAQERGPGWAIEFREFVNRQPDEND